MTILRPARNHPCSSSHVHAFTCPPKDLDHDQLTIGAFPTPGILLLLLRSMVDSDAVANAANDTVSSALKRQRACAECRRSKLKCDRSVLLGWLLPSSKLTRQKADSV